MATPVSLVLGLGREVGEATARRFHDAGHKVLAAGSDDDRVDEAREALPDDVSTFHGDLNTKLGLRNAITDADEAFGRIDNAVIIPRLPGEDVLTDAKEDVLEKTVSKPLSAAVQGIRLLADRMREQEPMEIGTISRVRQRGTITFVLAHTAVSGMPGQFSERLLQGALLSAVKASALELAEDTIRVNAILAIRPRAETTEPFLSQRTPLRRAALADEIADAALYLCSPQAAIVTGTTLTLDGGRSLLSGLMD